MGTKRILIADNDTGAHDRYRGALAVYGLDIVATAREAYDRLKSYRPDLVIFADTLPRVNLLELCRLIASGRLVSPPPVIIIAVGGRDALLERWPGLDETVTEIVVGPFEGDRLATWCRHILTGSGDEAPEAAVADGNAQDSRQLAESSLTTMRPRAEVNALEENQSRTAPGGSGDAEYGEKRIKDLEIELATRNLQVAELEVKVEEIIRLKSDFEKRAQDIIEQQSLDYRELKRNFEAMLRQRETLQMEINAGHAETEKAVVAKEQLEERLQAERQEWLKERSQLEAKAASESQGREVAARLVAENDSLNLERENLARRVSELESNLAQRDAAIVRLGAENDRTAAEVRRQLAEAGAELDRLQAEQSSAPALAAEIKQLKDQIEGLLEERGAARQSIEQLTSRTDDWQREIQTLRQEAAALRREKAAGFEDVRKIAEAERLRDMAVREKDAMAIRIEEARLRADELAQKLSQAERKLEAERLAADNLRSQLADLVRTSEVKGALLNEREAESERLRAAVQQAERELAEVRGAKKALEDEFQLQIMNELEAKEELRRRAETLEGRLSQAGRSDVDRIEDLKASLISAVTDAQREIVQRTRTEADLAARLESAVREKEDALRRLEAHLEQARQREHRIDELVSRIAPGGTGDSSPYLPATIAAFPAASRSGRRWLTAVLAVSAAGVLAGGFFLLSRFPIRLGRPRPAAESPGAAAPPEKALPSAVDRPPTDDASRQAWDKWTRRNVSGGVMLQATMRSREELRLSLEAEAAAEGWDADTLEREWNTRMRNYDFASYWYFYVYVKNLEPGYPGYADTIHRHVFLRDIVGNEVEGLLPDKMPGGTTITSHAPSPSAKASAELVYEVAAWIAFPRLKLAKESTVLQLVVYDIGATSRRVLTWEFAGGRL